MILKVRQCCCSLPTFVKTICIIFVTLYFCVGLSAVFWFLISENDGSATIVTVAEKEDGEINGFEEFAIDNGPSENNDTIRKTVIFAIVLVFAFTGAIVNLLTIVSIKFGKRSLILPWLIYHTGVIIGKNVKELHNVNP